MRLQRSHSEDLAAKTICDDDFQSGVIEAATLLQFMNDARRAEWRAFFVMEIGAVFVIVLLFAVVNCGSDMNFVSALPRAKGHPPKSSLTFPIGPAKRSRATRCAGSRRPSASCRS